MDHSWYSLSGGGDDGGCYSGSYGGVDGEGKVREWESGSERWAGTERKGKRDDCVSNDTCFN
jgi:hypothetical protein